ncbi:twin-arginine translocation signal domain-containing protein [Haloarcula salinisoli]|uniref:Twin-arginine translocation signal domain-containing protein n=1 Tax=Haloarcula salinisoli TaxID=2487746 RepID=A0A8J8CAH8_9EURY|nr:twin-arginine translocation signal domain-containing protein [Halomicroarcula salinisoli]MBX0305279.1 twin-arginine translocation signal domain-containing protein [Halomicroarcula salinisoli]
MSTDDTRGNESIASTKDPSRRQFLGAAAAAATLSVDPPADPQASVSDDFAAQVATEHVQPALRTLTRPDYDRTEAIPKLERALSRLRQEAQTHPDERHE